METGMTMKLQITGNKYHIFTGALLPQLATNSSHFFPAIFSQSNFWDRSMPCQGIRVKSQNPGNLIKSFATRRRRANIQSDTYVLMEPGKNEEFVSEDELRERLKGWLENWPGNALPPDLARFESIDDAVQFLVKSVCELEIDGDVGSIQWYQILLE